VANAVLNAYRQQFPDDKRSDFEVMQSIAASYPEYTDRFEDFGSDLKALTRETAPQPGRKEIPPEILPYPASPSDYAKQIVGSGIRGITSTLSSIPEAFGTASRILGTYSIPGAEHIPMFTEATPTPLETGIARLGEAISPEPVEQLQKSFLATTVPAAVGSGIGFLAAGGAAGLAERGIIEGIGARAMARAVEGGLAKEEAVAAGQAAAASALRRLNYGNIASLGALSQAQQGYEEAKKAGADEHTRWLAFALNLPVGMTEAVPLAGMLNRLEGLSSGNLKKALLQAGIDSFEEALQNGFQGVAGDVIASKLAKYEPDRKIFSSLAEDAASGGISAAVLSLAASFIGSKVRGAKPEAAAPPAPANVPYGTFPITPPVAQTAAVPAAATAADVAAQYASEQQKAAERAARMQEVARRSVSGPFATDDIAFVSKLSPGEQAIYTAMAEQARQEHEAASATAEVKTAAAPPAEVPPAAVQPPVAPEKELVPPAAPPIAPVLFHSAMVVPGVAPLIYYTPTAELRGADGGIYKPGDVLTEQNLAGFTLPEAETAKAQAAIKEQTAAPTVMPVTPSVTPTPTVPAATAATTLPSALEALAQKVGRFSPEEQALLNDIITNQPELHKRYMARKAEVRAAREGAPPAAAPAAPPIVPIAPVTPIVPTPATTAPVAPSLSNVFVPPGYLTRARRRATAIALVAKRKLARLLHPSSILDTVDFDGDSPLTFELSARGTGERTNLAGLDPGLVVVSAGQHQGQQGKIVKITDQGTSEEKAWIQLKNGDAILVDKGEYKSLAAIQKAMSEEAAGRKPARQALVVAPAFFEIKEAPAATEAAVQNLGLVSEASVTGKIDRGSRNTWTHRWTVFRKENKVYFLPTYKSEKKIMAAEPGQKKGTPVVKLIKNGFIPVASFRAEKAVHAIEAAKPVLGVDEYEKTFASHARQRMAAAARSYAASAAAMIPGPAVETEEEAAATEPGVVQPTLPAEITFSKELGLDMFNGLTAALAQSPQKELVGSDAVTISTIAQYAMKGKYGKEIRDTILELAREIGERKASRIVLNHIVGAYNLSRTSQEFAEAISTGGRTGAGQAVLAAGGIGGLPVLAGDRTERGAGQPAVPVQAIPQNVGVASGPAVGPTTGPAQGPVRFRVVEGGYASSADVRAKLQAVLEAAAAAGIDVSVVESAMQGGMSDGNAIVLLMRDIARPSTTDFVSAVHEIGHQLFGRESPEMQRMLHRAIDRLSDAALALEGTGDPRARLDNIGRLNPETLAEERLMESLANEGFDPVMARSWSQRILRALKDLWNRACISIQHGLFGPDAVNPERVVEYFRNRLRSLLAGDPTPMSFVNFLGGKRLSLERAARFYVQTDGSDAFAPVIVDWENGRIDYAFDASATSDAVAANIRNALRDVRSALRGPARFRRPGYVAEGEVIGGEDPTVRAGWNFAAAKETLAFLQAGYDAFNATGANPVNTAGVRAITLDNFIGLISQDMTVDHPQAIMDRAHEELAALGAPPLNPDLSINGPVTFENDATRKQAQAITLSHANQYLASMNGLYKDENRRRDSIKNQLEKKIAKSEALVARFQNMLFHVEAAKEAIADLITQTKADIRSVIYHAKGAGMLTQALKDLQADIDPIPAHYEALLDKMAKRIFDDAEHFSEFLEQTAALHVNWQAGTLPQLKAQLRVLLDTNPLFHGLTDEERNICLTLIGSWARANDHHIAWIEVRQSNNMEAIAAIRAMMNAAKTDTTEDLNATRGLANKVPNLAKQADRILTQYNLVRKESKVLLDDQLRNTRIIQFHEAAAPVFGARIRLLEKDLGGSRPVALEEGAKLPYVRTENDTSEEIAAAEPWEYHSTGDDKATPAQVGTMLRNYEAWIRANEATGGAMVETLRDLVKRLNVVDAAKELTGLRETWLARLMGSLSDAVTGTGSVIGKRIGQALARYAYLEGSFTNDLAAIGVRAAAARGRAMRALGIKDTHYFITTFHDGAFGYFEKRKDLQERPNAHEAALAAWRAHLLANPATHALVTPAAWERLKTYYEECVRYVREEALNNKQMGNKLKDDNLGMYRDPIGDPMFAMPRGLNSKFELVFHAMRGAWNGVKSPKIKGADIAERFTADPDALATSLGSRFTSDVWRLFVGGMASREGRSMFSGRLYAPGKWTIAAVENVRRAYQEASAVPTPGGKALTFAIRLHELEGNTPDILPTFVGETLETFQNYFDDIERIMAESEEGAQFGMQKGVPRFLMDARISEDYPTAWLSYQHVDQHNARQAIHRFAFHAAFGRGGSTVTADFHAAIDELGKAANQWQDYLSRARDANPTKSTQEILKAARVLAGTEGQNVTLLENARNNEAILRKTQDQFAAWFKSHAEDSVEPKVFLEILSFITGFMVQGPKTAMINTMDLFGGPVIQYGLSAESLRQVRDNWKGFFATSFGSLFQTFGIQLNLNIEDRLLMDRIGLTDSDTQIRLMDRIGAAWNEEVHGAGRLAAGIIKATRLGKAITQAGVGTGVYPTLKAAPFSMISRAMNEGFILSTWGRFRGLAARAVAYLRAHPAEIDNHDFSFTAAMLGYPKGTFLDEAGSFDAVKEAMTRWGMRLENVARAALHHGAPLFTDEQHRALAEMALDEMSLEASPISAPRWSANPAGRFTMPLLRWSFARTNQLRKAFQEPDGRRNLHAVVSGLKALSLATGVGIAYALLMERYDEELTHKRSDIRGFGQDNNFLAVVEMTARMGSLGLWGDAANTVLNYAGTGDLRGFSLDNRVVVFNSIINTVAAITTFAKQGEADYASVYRPLIGALGGAGYMQSFQVLNNLLSADNAEARVTARINAANILRGVGREMNLDVRIGRASGAYVAANPITPAVSRMVLAALADDQADFLTAYNEAITATREENLKQLANGRPPTYPDPAEHVRRAYASRNLLRTVFQTPPTEGEYQQMLARLPAGQREDVQLAVLLQNKFAGFIGASEFEGQKDKKQKPPPLFGPVQRNVGNVRANLTRQLYGTQLGVGY